MTRTRLLVSTAVLVTVALAQAAFADTRIEKNLKLDPGGKFILEADAGSVTVTGSKESGAHVVITSSRSDLNELFTMNFDEGQGSVHVTLKKIHRFESIHHLELHFEVRVPTETSLDVRTGGGSVELHSIKGSSEVRTSGGSIEISEHNGAIRAETSGGGIRLREVTGGVSIETSGGGIEVGALDGALRASTSGGPIQIDRVTGDVVAETSGGPIRIEGAGGRVEAKTSGGSVQVKFDRGNARGGTLETSGGSVRVSVDPKVNLTIEASASGGGVATNLPITVVGRLTHSSLHGNLGSGGETLRLQTSGGSVSIEPL